MAGPHPKLRVAAPLGRREAFGLGPQVDALGHGERSSPSEQPYLAGDPGQPEDPGVLPVFVMADDVPAAAPVEDAPRLQPAMLWARAARPAIVERDDRA